jgi:hypothetical protein
MRFGRNHSAPAEEPERNELWVVSPEPAPALALAPDNASVRELFVRYARRDGRLIALLRAVDQGGSCVVETEVYPRGSSQLVRPGPYTFADAQEASEFVTEAVTALMYLGCDIQAQ